MIPKEKFKQLTNLDYNAASIIRLSSDLIGSLLFVLIEETFDTVFWGFLKTFCQYSDL